MRKPLLNVSILYPNEYSYSETFIRNHIQRLPENVFPLYGAWFPFLQPGRKHILSPNVVARAHRRMQRSIFNVPYQEQIKRAFINYLKRNKIDVVLAEYGLTGVAVMKCCEDAKVPLVVHFHGFDAYEYETIRKNETAYKVLFHTASKVIVVSVGMKDQLYRLGCPNEKIVVNACGVDTEYFMGGGCYDFPPQYVAVGRLTPVKGPQLTIKAFYRVVQEIKGAKLVMVGDGELLNHCKALTRELGISHAVKFTGPLDPEGVRKVLRASNVFVQHGIANEQVGAEGLGLSVLEASSTGLPVVVTRHGGLQECVVHGETGFMIEEGDIAAMAECMKMLAQDVTLCREMGANGRRRIQKYFDLRDRIEVLDHALQSVCYRK